MNDSKYEDRPNTVGAESLPPILITLPGRGQHHLLRMRKLIPDDPTTIGIDHNESSSGMRVARITHCSTDEEALSVAKDLNMLNPLRQVLVICDEISDDFVAKLALLPGRTVPLLYPEQDALIVQLALTPGLSFAFSPDAESDEAHLFIQAAVYTAESGSNEENAPSIEGRRRTTTQSEIESAQAPAHSLMDGKLGSDGDASGIANTEVQQDSRDAEAPSSEGQIAKQVVDSGGVTPLRSLRIPPKTPRTPEPIDERGTERFLAAAASRGKEKPRALRQDAQIKIPLGEVVGTGAKCSFYAVGEKVFVGFDRGEAPARLSFGRQPTKTYALSLEADVDGHHEIIEMTVSDITPCISLRRKPRW